MNPQLNFRYRHSDHTRVLRDVRHSLLPEVSWARFYFTGLRIDTEEGVLYRHALIVADDYDAFAAGISDERNAILEQHSATSRDAVALVFVRNLLVQDSQMIDSISHHHIDSDIEQMLSKRDDNRFSVFGRLGEAICLIPVTARDALAAIQIARYQSALLAGKDFMPLEVRQAHPVTKEFDALFQSTAKRIQCLIDSVPAEGGHRH